jgi:Ran GTPase-activating protein (RanGAP) involved in mRNA processing and transport
LKLLNLSRNNIGLDGIKYISAVLKVNTSLESLNLSGNKIGDHGVELIAIALCDNFSLSNLSITSNSIGDVGIDSLTKAFSENETLQFLDISNNPFGEEGLQVLFEEIQLNYSMQEICIGEPDKVEEEELIVKIQSILDKNKKNRSIECKMICFHLFDLFSKKKACFIDFNIIHSFVFKMAKLS